jgi:heme O synthase-like polyprenyltransferase
VGLIAITLLDLFSVARRRWSGRLFAYSIAYLALLFTLFAVSPLLP